MKYILIIFTLFFSDTLLSQTITPNQHPGKTPIHILDDKLTDISFALSLRVLESDYNGSLVRLRRANDNALQDFGWGDNDKVDVSAINTWRGTSAVYVHTWYDQSGLGRNAVQTINSRQPRFFPSTTNPYFKGDGVNDYLIIDTPNGIQDVTNNGVEGTVLGVMNASKKAQHTFGVLTGVNRWSTHINWSNNNVYFDPGICCNNPRYFNNTSNLSKWAHYTFIRTTTNAIARSNGVQRFNGSHTNGKCTRTEDFTICWANGNGTGNYATTSFSELIMYKTDIAASQYQQIEKNSNTFWNL